MYPFKIYNLIYNLSRSFQIVQNGSACSCSDITSGRVQPDAWRTGQPTCFYSQLVGCLKKMQRPYPCPKASKSTSNCTEKPTWRMQSTPNPWIFQKEIVLTNTMMDFLWFGTGLSSSSCQLSTPAMSVWRQTPGGAPGMAVWEGLELLRC